MVYRIEISVKGLDNPAESKLNKPYRETNQFVRFTHTSLEKDAGQTTVPLFDALEASMKPAMPLNGIGLYYKTAPSFGGYIAPRLFTDSMDKYLDITDIDVEENVNENVERFR